MMPNEAPNELRDRAERYRQLARMVDDRKAAVALETLALEYERQAEQDARTGDSPVPDGSAGSKWDA